ncbi:hypothetical protein M422DRAFT_181469 [Sphaerobolus stellatus SS14]|uniref:Uncharacterized protein n=1 Tax=Sphaerobolus stellatus (strain SS14) TaxID=990650 RepID=A0A0C9TX23_SPHS4|nr:hypothetical protein M422DRAFT_181469 [Sphaerobolus stellatus SS14]
MFGEINSGDVWHYYQSLIGPEEMVNPAILASDGTHLTNFSGDGKVHLVYISSGQIHGDICNQPNHCGFLLLCYLPVCKAWLTHKCLRIVLQSLKAAGHQAVPMVNYCGEEQMNRVFLAAWIADKEEQNLLAALGANSCVACHAKTEHLGEEHMQKVISSFV